MTGELVVLVGLPASGKSTFARGWLAERPTGFRVRLSRDDLRLMALPPLYKVPVPTVEDVISLLQHAAVQELLDVDVDVIVDDTNLNPRHVAAWVAHADAVGACCVVVDHFLDVPVEECVARDPLRRRPVGADVIRGMADRWAGEITRRRALHHPGGASRRLP